MIEADSVLSTPPLNSSSICPTEARAESVDSFSHQPRVDHRPDEMPPGDSPKTTEGLSRRLMLAGLAGLPVAGIPAAASAVAADAELIALGRKFEILVDAYYAARQPWARAMSQYHGEIDERFGDLADLHHRATPEIKAAMEDIDDRVGLKKASDQLSAVYENMEPIADTINAMPCTSVEGLRSKALVAFWRVAPLCAGDSEYGFDNEHAFQHLFCAVAELCGLDGKIAATGFGLPNIDGADQEDEGEEV